MKVTIVRPIIWSSMCVTIMGLMSCSTSPVVSRVIVEDTNRLVRLDVTYRSGSQEHHHPANFTAAEISTLLSAIEVNPEPLLPGLDYNQEGEKALSKAQISFLAPHLAQAFEKATPLEEILFYWNQTRDNNIQEITSGSVFLDDENLHVLFANFRWTTSGKRHVERVKSNPLTVLGNPRYELRMKDNQSLSSDQPWWALASSSPQHLVISYTSRPPRSSNATNPPSATNAAHDPKIRERLQSLAELRREGLITEQEFQKKRKEILESL
jgi:hypothetical protein